MVDARRPLNVIVLLLDLPEPLRGSWPVDDVHHKIDGYLGCPCTRQGALSPVLRRVAGLIGSNSHADEESMSREPWLRSGSKRQQSMLSLLRVREKVAWSASDMVAMMRRVCADYRPGSNVSLEGGRHFQPYDIYKTLVRPR